MSSAASNPTAITLPASGNTDAHAVQKPTGTLEFDVVSDTAGLTALKQEWIELCNHCHGATVFQTWEWCSIILELNKNNPEFAPYVLTARKDGRLSAFLPLKKSRKPGRKILTGLAEPFQQYTELLIDPQLDAESVIKAWLPLIRKSGCDVLHLGQVRKDSALAKSVGDLFVPIGELDAAPYIALDQWPDFDTYYKTLKSKTRKNMRNARNRLEKTAPIRHEVRTGGDEFAAIVKHTFIMRREWLKQTGLTSRAFGDEEFWNFLEQVCRLAENPNNDFGLIGMSLKHGDEPIAEQWGITYQGRYHAFISGWKQEYDSASPGKLHLGEVIRTCYDRQLTVVDFMMPSVPYKQTWARTEMTVQDYAFPITPTGLIYSFLWLNFLRPIAKTCALKLPIKARTKLFSMLGWV